MASAWMHRPTGGRQVAGVLGPPLVVALVILASWYSVSVEHERERWFLHTRNVLLQTAMLRETMLRADRGAIDSASAVAAKQLDTLHTLTIDNPHQKPRLDSLDRLVAEQFAALRQPVVDIRVAHAVSDTIQAVAARVSAEEEQLLVVRRAALLQQRVIAIATLLGGGALAVLLAVLVNYLFARYAAEEAAARVEIAEQNAKLQEQTMELELQAQALQEQAAEYEAANDELNAMNEQLVQSNAALDQARGDADAANRTKAEFLAAMSHDLRTPLNAVNGYTDLLLTGVRGPMTPSQTEDLQRIRRAGLHLMGLINDVLNYAKLEAGALVLQRDTFPVEGLLADAAALIEPQALGKQITFERVPCAPDVVMTSDREKLLQIVLNLLTNAVKFTESGGRMRLVCGSNAADAMMCIAVEDTGRGIPADQLVRIFEPFVQLDRRLHGNDGGAGLGLAISRGLAQSMDGDLQVTSVVGIGSTFTLVVPRVPSAPHTSP